MEVMEVDMMKGQPVKGTSISKTRDHNPPWSTPSSRNVTFTTNFEENRGQSVLLPRGIT